MHRASTILKASALAFISGFCVMVIELIAARMLAPYIGVSVYTWTSIIGVILASIALGNYLGGKIADKNASPLILVAVFLIGGLATIAIFPAAKIVISANWFNALPLVCNLVLQVFFIFFLPTIILSMVSPLLIKSALADLRQTGGIVGTIYAFSTIGSILGTFLAGFYFILWFGTINIIWIVAGILLFTGVLISLYGIIENRRKPAVKDLVTCAFILVALLTSILAFQHREALYPRDDKLTARYEVIYEKESNYFTIRVIRGSSSLVLVLDTLVHSIVSPGDPTALFYSHLDIFKGIVSYVNRENSTPKVLHLGGGGYSFPRYLEVAYPNSVNDVVEIDPLVTQVASKLLGLPPTTTIKTYNQDARYYLMRRDAGNKYDIIVGDVFNDRATPYHLTTLEFDQLVKASLYEEGVYLINIIDIYQTGRYMPAFVNTLQHVFKHVYLFGDLGGYRNQFGTFVIVATDRLIDLADYREYLLTSKKAEVYLPEEDGKLQKYLKEQNPVLLTDDYVPTDILVAPIQPPLFKNKNMD